MNLRRISTRAAVAGATTALAAGALVATATAPANAATVSNTYTCTYAAMAVSFDTTLTVTGELPVPQYWAGASVPPGLLTIQATADAIPAAMIEFAGVTSAESKDFAFDLNGKDVPVALSGAVDATTTTWSATGANAAFTTPNPGLATAVLPDAFTLTAKSASADYPLDCTLKDGETAGELASITLLKQKSETVASNASAKKGKKVVVPVSVTSTSIGGPVSGKVVAKEGKKTLGTATLKKGKASIALGKKLKPGKHKITVTYSGIPSVGGSSDKVVVTIKKK